MKPVYLDYAATTPVDARVVQKMLPYFCEQFGNPSSLYAAGRAARQAVSQARRQLAALLDAEPDEIFFTSGGSESDNWVIRSLAEEALRHGGGHIITTKVEHHAVLHACEALPEGIEVTYLDVDAEGRVRAEQVEAALARHDTDLGLVESSARHPGFHYEPFIPDELVLIASTKGWYGRCDQVTLAELQTVPLVLRESGSGTLEVISKYLAAADVRLASLRVVMQLGSTESIKSFVRNSDAMAIVSVASIVDELRSGELRIIDIEGCTIRREFSFCWPEGRSDALAARFVEFARHTA